MRILLSAYACEPNRGSEPGIGWKWSIGLASNTNNEIFVLTRSNNKICIDNYFLNNNKPNNLHFFYYDLPNIFIWLKHHGLPVNLYYSMWLYGAGLYAKKLHESFHFDVAHHITFGVFRDASFLYKLKIPYMVGPVGGGEMTPPKLNEIYSFKYRIKENIRKLYNKVSLINPFLIKSLDNASIILTKTNETRTILNKRNWLSKTFIQLELGINQIDDSTSERDKNMFIYVGNFLHWKGIKLVLESFLLYYKKYNKNAQLIFIGKGAMLNEIEKFINKNKLSENIKIITWVEQYKLKSYYKKACALIFPSLHDSSGNVVLEAISNGLPVISLKTGGPATVLGETYKDLLVPVDTYSKEQVIKDIALKMNTLSHDDLFYKKAQEISYSRAKDFEWHDIINKTYNLFLNNIH